MNPWRSSLLVVRSLQIDVKNFAPSSVSLEIQTKEYAAKRNQSNEIKALLEYYWSCSEEDRKTAAKEAALWVKLQPYYW